MPCDPNLVSSAFYTIPISLFNLHIYLSLVFFFAALKCKPSPVSDGHALIIIGLPRWVPVLRELARGYILPHALLMGFRLFMRLDTLWTLLIPTVYILTKKWALNTLTLIHFEYTLLHRDLSLKFNNVRMKCLMKWGSILYHVSLTWVAFTHLPKFLMAVCNLPSSWNVSYVAMVSL